MLSLGRLVARTYTPSAADVYAVFVLISIFFEFSSWCPAFGPLDGT
jgi:hypothetical protein